MDRIEALSLESEVRYALTSHKHKEAVDLAFAALKEQSNEPLTLEQLRGMHGEPVWIIWPDRRIKSKWWIVGSPEWLMMEFMGSQSEKEYGTDWIAYRNKLGDAEE